MTALLVAGATGLVGGELLARALADARVTRVVAPTRRALPVHAKLDNPVVDFEALPADAPWWRVDAVACALGTTIRAAGSRQAFRRVDVEHVLAVGAHARRAGATAFALVSAASADARSRVFYLRCKGEAEDGLRALDFPSLTIARPALIGGDRPLPRPMERLGLRVLRAAAPVIPKRHRVIEAGDIATALLEAVLAATPGHRVQESEAMQPA